MYVECACCIPKFAVCLLPIGVLGNDEEEEFRGGPNGGKRGREIDFKDDSSDGYKMGHQISGLEDPRLPFFRSTDIKKIPYTELDIR